MAEPAETIRLDSEDVARTEAIGRAVGRCCLPGDVVALEGELGAGKTQFVRGLANGLGLDPRQVSSPTFVIVQEYDSAVSGSLSGGTRTVPGVEVLIHIDAYRLRSAEDLASIGWEGDGASMREGAVVAIEWASLMGEALPADRLAVRIEHEPVGRAVFLSAQGVWTARMAQVRRALAP